MPAYRKRLAERFGCYPFQFESCIWFHAVSVGESKAAVPLISGILSHYREPVLVTTMTPTGAAILKQSFGDKITHAYVPYDMPFAVRNFLKAARPKIGIIMETELWPNLLLISQQQSMPLCLLNARLSQRSALAYRKIFPLMRNMLSAVSKIGAQTEHDANRFIQLGVDPKKIKVTGNIKFDLNISQAGLHEAKHLRALFGINRFIWIAASTHQGEEEIILAAHQLLLQKDPHALLILVPRHPDRFNEAASLCEAKFKIIRRSQTELIKQDRPVYLGDTLGELLLLYAVSDVAFVGGSLVPAGGHNLIEPAFLKKPVITGPHLFNFSELEQLFSDVGVLTKIKTHTELANLLHELKKYPDRMKEIGERSHQLVAAHRGVIEKQFSIITDLLHAVPERDAQM